MRLLFLVGMVSAVVFLSGCATMMTYGAPNVSVREVEMTNVQFSINEATQTLKNEISFKTTYYYAPFDFARLLPCWIRNDKYATEFPLQGPLDRGEGIAAKIALKCVPGCQKRFDKHLMNLPILWGEYADAPPLPQQVTKNPLKPVYVTDFAGFDWAYFHKGPFAQDVKNIEDGPFLAIGEDTKQGKDNLLLIWNQYHPAELETIEYHPDDRGFLLKPFIYGSKSQHAAFLVLPQYEENGFLYCNILLSYMPPELRQLKLYSGPVRNTATKIWLACQAPFTLAFDVITLPIQLPIWVLWCIIESP